MGEPFISDLSFFKRSPPKLDVLDGARYGVAG
jgi:hypothetical protein